MKSTYKFSIILTVLSLANIVYGQPMKENKNPTVIKYNHSIDIPFGLFSNDTLTQNKDFEKPDFIVGEYLYYLKIKKIGYANAYVPRLSSSGYGTIVFEEIENIDYDSFEIINTEWNFAKDKNDYYLDGVAQNIKPLPHHKILHKRRQIIIINGDNFWKILPQGKTLFSNCEYVNDVIYSKNDSLYFYTDNQIAFSKNPPFDKNTLITINDFIFQDNKNLYFISRSQCRKIENEQIIDKREFADSHDKYTLYIGNNNFYNGRNQIFNEKLTNYHFFEKSNYLLYNGHLNFMKRLSPYKVMIEGSEKPSSHFKNEVFVPDTITFDPKKVKIIGDDFLIYNNERFFNTDREISFDSTIEIEKLEYKGKLPEHLKNLIKTKSKNDLSEKDIFMCNNKYYGIDKKAHLTELINANAILKSFKRINEYYYVYKDILYGHKNDNYFNHYPNQEYPKSDIITNRSMDFNKVKAFDMYITDGTNLWYKSKKIDAISPEIEIRPQFNRRAFSRNIFNLLTLNNEVSSIIFDNLHHIKGTEYITDGNYLLYEGNIIGKINESTIKVLSKNYIEDVDQFFFDSIGIKKKDLK